VGALCFIKTGDKIPRRSLVVGNPGKIIREVSDEMIAWKTKGTALYQQLPAACFSSLRAVEDGQVVENTTPAQQLEEYKIWKKSH
jgi:carbonic anhydrase/acetyltransferase-like protein (isoleucine patch superfamily)